MSALAGRHVIVTGGGRGIGAAVAAALARRGATLTLLGRDADRLEAHAGTLRAAHGVEVLALRCDVRDEDAVRAALARSRERFPAPWGLVNNAGVGDSAPVAELSLARWNDVLAVNLTGAFLCIREVLPAMEAAGGGRIVNVASTAALKGYARLASYVASKHGLLGLTRAVALEAARHGITVNAVCPAYTDTDLARQAVDNLVRTRGLSPEEARQRIVRQIPRGELIRPEEVAEAVAWLCSPGSSGVTGQAIAVAGGEV